MLRTNTQTNGGKGLPPIAQTAMAICLGMDCTSPLGHLYAIVFVTEINTKEITPPSFKGGAIKGSDFSGFLTS